MTDIRMPDALDVRMHSALEAVAEAANLWAWDKTDADAEQELRDAVAEWRSATGLIKLRDRDRGEG